MTRARAAATRTPEPAPAPPPAAGGAGAYVRTRGGRFVHRPGCARLAQSSGQATWRWAEGKTPAQLRAAGEALGLTYQFCRRCLPEAAPR